MFNQILVPIDGSLLAEFSLPHTVAMAQAFRSKVMLLRVLDPMSGISGSHSVDPWDWQIQHNEAQAYLKELASQLLAAGLPVRTAVVEGKTAENILIRSDRMDSNLIILSSHGEGGLNGWSVNSVVLKTIQRARTSVMIVPSYHQAERELVDLRYRRILVPLDGSQRAEYALSTAVHLAKAHESELFIAHVVKPPDMPRKMPLSDQEMDLKNQVVESNRVEAEKYLNHLKGSLDCRVETLLLVSENVADTLHAWVEEKQIDLVILNAHGISSESRRPYGNVAVNFLAYSAAPLLVVQDFTRERIGLTQAETFAEELLGRQLSISN